MENGELYHHGIKGQKWGIRRYQKKDGSLTKAGEKRYNKEMDKLKAEKQKLKNEERTRKKMAKLDKMKSDVDGMKKKKDGDEPVTETPEAKRKRLLESSDPKELYENKHLLTTQELNDRINRIDTEARLKSKIVEEKKQTGMDYVNSKMESSRKTLNNVTNLYKSVDEAYSAVANSAIGKTLAKQLGIELPDKKKSFDLGEFWKNKNKKSAKEIQEVAQRLANEKRIDDEINRRKKKGESVKHSKEPDKDQNGDFGKSGKKEKTETFTGTVEGEGTSRYTKKQGPIYDADFTEATGSKFYDQGRNYVDSLLLLEDRNRR